MHDPGTVFGRKKGLMMDDPNCDDQIRVLEYLVAEKGLHPPSAFMAIRFRQCSVIRWLLANGRLDLDGSELEIDFLVWSEAMSAEFNISVDLNLQLNDKKFLLCLATVQHDDVQTLNYLVDSYGSGIIGHMGFGFNLVHATALSQYSGSFRRSCHGSCCK